ncbi:MAG: hypothetical protein IT356_04085 [Gemmatimonadaceae bacterium]|nr:hypothetical protein [Gemmatimonadaceae bacterium]
MSKGGAAAGHPRSWAGVRNRRSWMKPVLPAAVLVFGAAAVAAAQQTVSVTGPAGDPVHDGTPLFTVAASGFAPDELPMQLRLQVALSADFSPPLFADTVVTGTSATIVIPRLLPQGVSIWWRVQARSAKGALFVSNAEGPRRTMSWLSLTYPNNLNGTTVATTRPAFLWSSVAVHPPVAPWRYTIVISRSADGFPVVAATLSDTTFVPAADLESNTPYRWAVSAVAGTGDSVRAVNASSFVITSPNAPVATILYQSFPTPFPTDNLQATCVWFDLRRQSAVSLDVLDIRGNHVKRLLPGSGLGGTLPPGRYGRAAFGSDSGCDTRLAWDGTDDRGRYVPPGVYLIRFSGDGVTEMRKVLFRGR